MDHWHVHTSHPLTEHVILELNLKDERIFLDSCDQELLH